MTKEQLLQLVMDAGASAATYIQTEDIVLSEEFRGICEKNQCGAYGRFYTCPPFVGEPDILMAELRSYPGGILYQSVGTLEDSFDYEGMAAAAARHMALSREISRRIRETDSSVFPERSSDSASDSQESIPPNRMLHLSKGGCDLCEECGALAGTACRFPALAMSSLEAYCIDVYQTAKAAGLKYINGAGTVTYFGLLLFDAFQAR